MSAPKAKKYAVMFLNATAEASALRGIGEITGLGELMEGSPGFRGLMVNPVFTGGERAAALGALAKKMGLLESTVKFALYLAGAGTGAMLPEVAQRAAQIHAERMKLAKATVITPVPIGREYDARLKESLAKLTGKSVEIEYVTDPSLVGGMLVKVGSTMYDGSLDGQLRLLRAELIKG